MQQLIKNMLIDYMKTSKARCAVLFLSIMIFMPQLLSAQSFSESVSSELFRNPNENTRPRCYWYWFDNQVSKEGITRDLEAMKRVGIGGAYIGIIGGAIGRTGPLIPKPMTDLWWENLIHAVREGSRLGIDIGFFNCPGWSQSGGPWVKPSESMRYLVQEEIHVQGPKRYCGKVPYPIGKKGDNFQSVALLAYRVPVNDEVIVPVKDKKGNTINFYAKKPTTVRSLVIQPIDVLNTNVELLISDDGKNYRLVRRFKVARITLKHGLGPISLAPVSVAFPAVTARYFQLNFKANGMPFTAEKMLGEILLSSAPKVEDFAGKALLKSNENGVPPYNAYVWVSAPKNDMDTLAVQPQDVIDLTAKLQADSTILWNVPTGHWVIQHIGMIPTGTTNKPAPLEITGPEVDKINRKHLPAFFDGYMGELFRRLKPAERTAWKYIIADSYETGFQNWTDGLQTEFEKAYGYNPLPYLPSVYGRMIGSADISNRFLWDLRRLVANRVAYEYVGGLRDLTNAHGMKLWLENYGHFGFPSEFLLYGGNADEISGEFWLGKNRNVAELRAASSAAHIYGKSPVWAEAFTSRNVPFQYTPRSLKVFNDWAFCEGINQFVLHVYIHQPNEDKPGINAWFGTEFNRHNTWFEKSKSWIDYLRSCSVLLQTGKPVADFAIYITEDAPKMVGPSASLIPHGHDYDYINADVILNRLKVSDGRLTLPDGVSYAALIIPDTSPMRPAVAHKIKELADAGAKIIGPKPTRSPSLENYPQCDDETRKYAVWNTVPDAAGLGLAPDVIAGDSILWKHRQTRQSDIYFISNQSNHERTERLSFRVMGREASLWNAVTREIKPIDHIESDARSLVDVKLPPEGSVFVVFNDKELPIQFNESTKIVKAASERDVVINGPWQVSFPAYHATFDTLVSWSSRPEQEIKYFSGTANYVKMFKWKGKRERVCLDLGRVESLATVCVNGKEYPTLWTYPYQVDITSALKKGENILSVEVVNSWHNRLVGDAGLPSNQRQTRITYDPFKKDDDLQPSGLMGPVRLIRGNQ
jgi:hypothetical protein